MLTPRTSAEQRASTPSGKPNFAYIDCLRGYAVLLVIATHVTDVFPELPSPVHKLGQFGWHGVQLFFVASCLTLMLSAHYELDRTKRIDIANFFIRRVFRIAPMYDIAAAFYSWINQPPHPTLSQLLASLLFVNAWHPVTTTTTGAWQVVPGGWSIGVEFTFYFLFPLFVFTITSFARAGALLIAAILVGAVLNSLTMPLWAAPYGQAAADNFLYFWFFNQLPVFVIGAMTYFAIVSLNANPNGRVSLLLKRRSGTTLGACVAVLVVIAVGPIPFSHHLLAEPAVPQFLIVSVVWGLFVVALSQAQRSLLNNPVVAHIGKVSFSGYLLQFAVIHFVLKLHPGLFHLNATGWSAIFAYGVAFIAASVVTYCGSVLTYRLVEMPMMNFAKLLTRKPIVALRTAP